MRETRKNAAEDRGWKLPRTRIPEPIQEGVKGWRTGDGYLVIRVHYSADSDSREEGWKDKVARIRGYRGGTRGKDWQREMEIDFSSYSGDPVYPHFQQESIRVVRFDPTLPLWRGWDFGFRNPAVVFLQYDPTVDRLHYLHELFPTLDKNEVPGMDTSALCSIVDMETQRLFPEAEMVSDYGDPSGNNKSQTSDFSSFEIMMQHGMNPEWNVVGRKNRIGYARRYVEGGAERFIINPHCVLGIEGFNAAYRYPQEGKGGKDIDMPDLSDKVQREPYIHIQDAFEYVIACELNVEWHVGAAQGERDRERHVVLGDLASMYLQGIKHPGDTVTDIDDYDPSDDPMYIDIEQLQGVEGDELDVDLQDAFLL